MPTRTRDTLNANDKLDVRRLRTDARQCYSCAGRGGRRGVSRSTCSVVVGAQAGDVVELAIDDRFLTEHEPARGRALPFLCGMNCTSATISAGEGSPFHLVSNATTICLSVTCSLRRLGSPLRLRLWSGGSSVIA